MSAADRDATVGKLVRRALGRRAGRLPEAELRRLERVFVDAGRHALRAHTGGPSEAARAIRFAKELLGTARLRLAERTRTGSPAVLLGPEWRATERVLDDNRERLVAFEGVVGFGLGYRHRAGVREPERCVKVYVRRKRDPAELADHEVIPPLLVAEDGATAPTDVVSFGTLEPQLDAGSSLGPAGTPLRGTVGCFARRRNTSDPVALTAMHVTGRQTGFPPGAEMRFASPCEGEPGSAGLGRLVRGRIDRVDAAAVAIEPPQLASGNIVGLGTIRGWRPVSLPGDFGTPVFLFGATSGLLSGVIVEPVIHLPSLKLESAMLVDIATEKGDSGAALVDNQNLVLGLLVGKSDAHGGLRVFTPIGLVLDLLDCEIP